VRSYYGIKYKVLISTITIFASALRAICVRITEAVARDPTPASRTAPWTCGVRNYSVRSACITSTRAARAAGNADAVTAAASSTQADAITGSRPGMRTS
jgi:hypothetical protein